MTGLIRLAVWVAHSPRLGGALPSPIAHIAYGAVGAAVLTAPLRDLEPRDHVGSLPESEPAILSPLSP
jgi:hypothetical protein